MNRKGFTLVELLAVIALVAILSSIAIPNIISTVNNSKKNTFLMDAKRMVSKAEYLLALNKTDRNAAASGGKIYSFTALNEKGEFQKDADDGEFSGNTYVKVTKSGSSYVYCICVEGSKRNISNNNVTCNSSTSSCVDSTTLTSIDVVKDNNKN